MTDTASPMRLPALIEGGRKRGFALLIGCALGEVTAQVAAAGALKALLVGAVAGEKAMILLISTGLAAALFAWARDVMGERFGLDYSNHVRHALARQALAVASSGGHGRFGTIAIRMTGDLSALKDWANQGVCGGLAGILGLFGAALAAWLTAGVAGLTATAIGPILALIAAVGLTHALHGEVRERRRHKGRLSAKIGDMLLGASASTAYGAEARAVRPVDRAGEDVLNAQTRQVAVATIMRLPALLTLPFGAAMAVLLTQHGLSPTGGMAGWAALLFALSLAALACSQLSGALIQFVERRIAVAKLSQLIELANDVAPRTPKGETQLKTGSGLKLEQGNHLIVDAGDQITVPREQAQSWLDPVLSGASDVRIDGIEATTVRAIDWARRVAYAGPARGLARGPLDLVLAGKRRADAEAIRTALRLAGLPAEWADTKPIIDPQSSACSSVNLARLRLARALAHGPRVLIIDDPWLREDEALLDRVRAWCAERGTSLIEIVGEPDQSDKTMRRAS